MLVHPEWLVKLQVVSTSTDWSSSEALKLVASPIAALLGSLISLVVSITTYRRVRQYQAETTNINLLSKVWEQIAKDEKLVEFHGFSSKDLSAKDLSPGDIGYLLGLFEAAAYHYEKVERGKGPFKTGSLRRQILESKRTRDAWPFLEGFFGDTPRFVRRVQATIDEIELQKRSWWRQWLTEMMRN